ncbi:hypothetical protein [Alteromonas sp. M12]|uniref:hypothetical protein n=1 Tax=Alteromonas sp. M12 TaxID=3135644 RepID=UPI00319E95C5
MKYLLMTIIVMFSSIVNAEDTSIDSDSILVTVILKHQQDKSLTELQAIQDKNEFWQSFPPEGMQIESWYVAMGLGQVITLRVSPKDLRTLNLAVEKSAWGSFTTEFYPTYEFQGIAKKIKASKAEPK